MQKQFSRAVSVIAGICVALLIGSAYTQTRSPVKNSIQKGAVMATHANGTFEVKLTPQAADGQADPALARILIDKQFHGDLEGTSKGQMLAAGSGAKGSSGGYVALERVTGTLHGRSGAFVLQHSGTMTRGAPELSVTVVPDSGIDQLVGLSGKMAIKIADGRHSYEFEYTLPETP